MISYSTYLSRFTDLTQNNTTANQTRGLQLINDSVRYLVQKYYFNENEYQSLSIANQQTYTLPYDVKDIVNCTVLVGGILWQPLEAPNRQFWDALNTIPFYSDFPQFFYRFRANQINLFPIPQSTGNPISINYKRRIRDLSVADYTTGTIAVTQWKLGTFTAIVNNATLTGSVLSGTPILANNDTVVLSTQGVLPAGFIAGTTYYVVNASGTNYPPAEYPAQTFTYQLSATMSGSAIIPTTAGSGIFNYAQSGTTVTGSGTTFNTNMANRWLQIAESAGGDGKWYQVFQENSTTSLTLWSDYQGASVSGVAYTLAEVPILPEDYQDLALFRALWIYYSSIVPNLEQAKAYQQLYEAGKEVLDYEFGAKSSNPVLTPPNAPVYNPNLFPRIS